MNYQNFLKIVQREKYDNKLAGVLCNLLKYLKASPYGMGACHTSSSVLQVALTELGFNPRLCIGEVKIPSFSLVFDHSWIELDTKVIDLAISMPLPTLPFHLDPIILVTRDQLKQKGIAEYGILKNGLNFTAKQIFNQPFSEYMDKFPGEQDGLWSVVNKVLDTKENITTLRKKYSNIKREYIKA